MCEDNDKKKLVWILPDGGDDFNIPKGASLKKEKGGYMSTDPKVEALDKKADFLLLLMSGVVVVLLAALAGMFGTLAGILTDGWRENVNSYIDYQHSVSENAENFSSINSNLNQMNEVMNELKDKVEELGSKTKQEVSEKN